MLMTTTPLTTLAVIPVVVQEIPTTTPVATLANAILPTAAVLVAPHAAEPSTQIASQTGAGPEAPVLVADKWGAQKVLDVAKNPNTNTNSTWSELAFVGTTVPSSGTPVPVVILPNDPSGNTTMAIPAGLAEGSALTDPQRIAAGAIPAAILTQTGAAGEPVILQNHRFEIQLIDFQMNNSANSDINQNILIAVQLTSDIMSPGKAIAKNLTLPDASPVVVNAPAGTAAAQLTSGLQQVFNGTYRTSADNKVHVGRTITQDFCGQNPDKALLTVTLSPLTGADGANFPQQSYTCVINLSFPTAALSSESFWSDIMQCNSGLVNGFSHRLWYKVRQYNINWNSCQQNNPNPVSVA
jgi:hypothetical protein